MRWRRVAVVIAGAAALLVSNAVAAEGPKKYALLIGVSFYTSTSLSTLEFADEDVEELARVLRNNGFDPVVAYVGPNATRSYIVATLYKFAATVNENDTFLLYFAGHGMRSKLGRQPSYWLTSNAAVEQLDVEGIRLNHLLDYVADIKSKRKIIILDHCFSADVTLSSDEAEPTRGARDVPPPRIIAQPLEAAERGGIRLPSFDQTIETAGGTIGIAAARGYAYELAELKHGVLTAALLEAFQGRKADTNKSDAKLSVSELSSYLRPRVKELSKNKQEAQIWTASSVNLDDWILVEKLPIDNVADATEAVIRYRDLFDDWYASKFMEPSAYREGLRMLETWKSSFSGGRPLSPDETKEIARLREVIEDQETAPEDRARTIGNKVIPRFFGRS